jgi:putative peptide zinc metalloprotease protein
LSAEKDFKLRSDLQIESVEDNGATFYVIKDPRSERFFRIKPLEYFLISQFDGQTGLDEIRRRASEEKKVLVSTDVLTRFAAKFRELGLLVDSKQTAEPREAPSSRWSGLTLKFPLTNPERFLSWLYPKTWWCFSAGFVAFMAATIIAAVLVAVANRHDLAFGIARVVSVEGLLFVLVTVSLVTILHELAHALTCRHFGGKVTDMGFLLLYFLPCFYVNVSDTYLFREKRQRLWVVFAGGYFEMFIWASSVLAWRVVAQETFVSRALFIVVAVCGIRSLFNFNPLIKMDGYFLLSDYLGIANLRQEALSGLTRFLRRAAALDVRPPAPEIIERRILALRGDRFLLLFGGAALLYTVALVGFLVFHSGEWVFDRYGANALALFSVVLVGLLHKPAISAATTAKQTSKEKWKDLGEHKRRPRFVMIWGGLSLLVALIPWQLRVPSELSVLPQERQTVRAPADGRIARIHVREGERVERGDLILEYDANELLLDRRTKQAELAQAEEELRLLAKQNPSFREEIRLEERGLETARAEEQAAIQEFDRARQLWTAGLISQDTFDGADNKLEQARARTRQSEARIALARKQSPDSRNEQMEVLHLKDAGAQEAAIEKLEAELAQLDDLLGRSKIYASIAGTLTTYRFEEKIGDFLEEGADVCEIANDDQVVVEMPVAEKDIDIIELGQAVKFKVRGYPSRSFRATVDEIAPVATPDGNGSSILLRAYVDNEDRVLKPGMTGVAKIYCGMSFVANVLTRDIVRFIRTEFWL